MQNTASKHSFWHSNVLKATGTPCKPHGSWFKW